MDLIDWITSGLRKPGKNKVGLAAALGRSPSKVTDLLGHQDRGANLKLREIVAIAEYLEEPPPPLARSAFVPIIAEIVAEPISGAVRSNFNDNLRQIAVPLGMLGAQCALRVGEHGMPGLAKDGWFVFCGERQEPPQEEQISELCRCGLSDGTEVVRFLNRSRYEGVFDLEGYGEPPLLAQRVIWAETVLQIVTGAGSCLIAENC